MNFWQRLFNHHKKNSQATLIAAWIEQEDETGIARIAIQNKSQLPVYKIILSTVNIQGQGSSGKDTPSDHRSFVAVLPPGTFHTSILSHRGMGFIAGIEMAFTDGAGISWLRTGDGIVRQLALEPAAYYELPFPISWEQLPGD